MAEQTGIPPLIHQTWKDDDVPPRWRAWAASWRRHHPEWEYRLWTDADNRAFLEQHYPWFLPVYDGYPEPIMRADAIRYFLLDHFGGVYADLDFECLRPVTDLLAGRELVLGLEPEEHTRLLWARRRGLRRVVGNAFLASRPGHPFWAHAHRELVGTHTAPGPLDATGPYFLTRAVDSAPSGCSISLLGPQTLYPVPSPHATEAYGRHEVDLSQAYAVHHWSGSWAIDASFRPRTSAARKIPFWTSEGLRPCATGEFDLDAQRARWAAGAPAPMVSCLMVTKDRPAAAARAIRCFLAQTYAPAELVVVDDSADDALERHIRALDEPRIRLHRLPPEGRTLGELRNVAVDVAAGPYVCQWDDDDLYDPERLEVQMAAIAGLGANACFLARERLWWPARRTLGISGARVWEGSMVCAKEGLPRYPALRRGEDSPVAAQVVGAGRVVSVDVPALYTYVCHGANTFDESHFASIFEAATQVWTGGGYGDLVREMAVRLPLDPADVLQAQPETPTPTPAECGTEAEAEAGAERGPAAGHGAPDVPPPSPSPSPSVRVPAARRPAPLPPASAERPPVLVLTPVKDAAAFLPGHLENLRALDYPREALSVGLLEGDSQDGTWELLRDALPALRAEFRRVTLVRRHFGLRLSGPRWEPAVQRRRRSVLARARNHLLSRALADEPWVLWLDADVTGCPPDLVQRLLGAGEDIVVPHCVTEPGGPTFDLNTFVLRPGADALDWSGWLRDGILQPPRGYGRMYLDELRGRERVRVDSVGGAGLLVRADLHRDGLVFPAVPYRHLIETEGLAAMARDMGMDCWGLPALEVVHPPHRRPEPEPESTTEPERAAPDR
ncbi:glycosyltransferase [Streptomyces coffeae]|uniref:Glycosyltransferase n=1 Tax=Streptomyces coffeae TaxID=621382 RepID=A0ABS1NDX1_9ACTN|nr:glycosyltransferase [Streptomyces coffeae]MBL1098006.1 glycosyltransferase [Streptomyces coffeae]